MDRRFLFCFVLLMLGLVSAGTTFSGSTNSVQYYSPTISDIYSSDEISTYWSGLNSGSEDCSEGVSDFIVGVVPGGCSPLVVTSDLLEEQDVPVFCQLYAVQVNPLIDVFSIDSVSFKGDYPDEVSGVSFYPAQAAIESQTDLSGTPLTTNIGYAVIVLEQEKVESNMSDFVSGNLTATISYDAESVYGVGSAKYYLGEEDTYEENSFWRGKGYLRLKGTDGDEATIEIYDESGDVYKTVTLEDGETSDEIYFPDYYCRVALKLKMVDVVSAEDSALLNVDGDEIWVRKGSSFLNGNCKVRDLDIEAGGAGTVSLYCSGETFRLKLGVSEDGVAVNNKVSDELTKVFGLSKETVEELVDRYRSEKKELLETTYGEQALFEEIVVAGEAAQYLDQLALANLFVEKYPTSDMLADVEATISKIGTYDVSDSSRNVYVGNDYHVISVEKFRDVDEDDRRVSYRYDGASYTDEKKSDRSQAGNDYVLVEDVDAGQAKFGVYVDGSKKGSSVTVKEGEYGTLNGKDIYVSNVDVLESAEISLVPVVNNKKTESNFSFSVGIEKRAIDLSPEKTEEMLRNLNETIARWTEINEKLGDLVTGMKGACFATASFLTIKNFVEGVSGEATARKSVMERIKAECSVSKEYSSSTACYNARSEEIEEAVASTAAAMERVNDKIEGVTGEYGSEGYIEDNDAYVQALRSQVSGWGGYGGLSSDDLTKADQVSSVLLVQELSAAGVTGVALEAANENMKSELSGLARVKEEEDKKNNVISNLKGVLGVSGVVAGDITAIESKGVVYASWSGKVGSDYGLSGSDATKKVQLATKSEKSGYYLLVLSETSKYYNIEKVLKLDGSSWVSASEDFNVLFYKEDKNDDSCSHEWKGSAKVSFYETGSAAKLPAFVPFDLIEGWYAKVSSDAYADSGDFTTLTICNIGSDGVSGAGDDCQLFNSNTASSVESFAGCTISKAKVASVYTEARAAVKEAAKQYGATSITINSQKMGLDVPASITTDYECQDFMSPDECLTLFNLCDPVICPSSRCDMGGRMSVSNVIQSGFVGSILLCLPNYEEGIKLPVCLSGLHASTEAWLSVLESERDCLETSLETGENVGICDAVTSIYVCEFFWNQFSTFMEKGVEFVFGNLFGERDVKGGGEYLFASDAWESTSNAIDYFKNSYATNAFAAFNLKSAQSAGGEFCEAYIGTSVPSNADLLDSLLAPESPTQFYAYFSSDTFTEATVPTTAQYKVYYHIYAGEDQGVQYKVYLIDPPTTSYYSNHQTVDVDSGYVAAGETVDETEDFTAPEGYKQLCVSINGKEECGYTSVSTSVAVDYVSGKYVEDEIANTDIESEDECVSGTASAWSLLSGLNLQSSAEEMIDGDISLNGIVRVCATSNPGNSVGNSSRWAEVGTCSDTMNCYLDKSSVQDALSTVAAVEDSSVSELLDELDLITEGTTAMTYEDVASSLAKLASQVEGLSEEEVKAYETNSDVIDILTGLNKIAGVGSEVGQGTNANRAYAYLLKGTVYQDAVRAFLKDEVPKMSACEAACFFDTDYLEPSVSMSEEDCNDVSGKWLKDVENGCCCYGMTESGGSSSGSTESSSGSTEGSSGSSGTGLSLTKCREEVGQRIVEIAKEIKVNEGIDDASVLEDTGYKSFECLALGLAVQESGLVHCTDDNCVDCGGSGYENVLKSSGDEVSYGVMQINTGVHSGSFDVLGNNVRYGLENVLVFRYFSVRSVSNYPRVYACNGNSYGGWNAALRWYNGWNTDCSKGNLNYVEDVVQWRSWVEENFAECGDGSGDSETSSPGFPMIKISYDSALELTDFFSYRWENGEVVAYVEDGGVLTSSLVCNWENGNECDVSSAGFNDNEKNLHGDIMGSGSWEEVVSKAKNVCGNGFEVAYYDADGNVVESETSGCLDSEALSGALGAFGDGSNIDYVEVYYNDGFDLVVSYRWDDSNSEIISKVEYPGVFGFGEKVVCDWSHDCLLSRYSNEFEELMHNSLIEESSWSNFLDSVKGYVSSFGEAQELEYQVFYSVD